MELNAAADNPLVSVPDQALISNGNFHPMVLAIAFDALRIALAHVGQLSERRMSHLWDGFFRQLAGGPPPRWPMGCSCATRPRPCSPNSNNSRRRRSLDTPPLDLGVEDHATSAPLSVRKTDAALGLLEDLLAIELLLARDVLATAPGPPALGAGTAAALRMVEQAIAAADPIRTPFTAPCATASRTVRQPGSHRPHQADDRPPHWSRHDPITYLSESLRGRPYRTLIALAYLTAPT